MRRWQRIANSSSSRECIPLSDCGRAIAIRSDWLNVVDFVAICSYILSMKTVSIRDAKNRLTELAREVERGETVVVTRNGRPAFDLVPHQKRKGLRLEAIDEFKRKHRIKAIVPYIADDFDEPLPEDFLLRPLPVDR